MRSPPEQFPLTTNSAHAGRVAECSNQSGKHHKFQGNATVKGHSKSLLMH